MPISPLLAANRARGPRRRQLFVLLALAAAAGSLTPPAQGQSTRAYLEILVIDAGTTQPIAGARVVDEASGRGGLADAQGRVELAVAAGDSVLLELSMLGYASRSLTVRPTGGTPLPADAS